MQNSVCLFIKKLKMKKIATIALLFFSTFVYADEGMWMLTDLRAQNEAAMMELGLEIPIDQVYSPDGLSLKDAVVHFGRGCTGEVISKEGLVLTNHHCGYGAIQQLSSVKNDYLTDGFWAMSRSEELPCDGLTITFIDKILDVTSFVEEQLRKDKDPDGTNYLSPKYLSTVAERFIKKEKIKKHAYTELELKPFYGGNRYYLFIKTVYNDIRMVGAPPSSIGKFGADSDNWMWPRHCGDFSLFRIYADKEGKPAPYSPQNKPLKVKKHLKISLGGIKENDFTFVMGFPGRNWRYMISDEVEERMETTNFMRHRMRDVRLDVLAREMEKDPAVRIHYASKYASSANYWKNAIGMNEGLTRLGVLDTKKKQQEELLAWGKAKGDTSYQDAFNEIRTIVGKRRDAIYHQQAIMEGLVTAQDFMKIPRTRELENALKAKKKKKIKRAVQRLEDKAYKYFESIPYPEVEKQVGEAMLTAYRKYVDRKDQIEVCTIIDAKYDGSIEDFITDCFTNSIFSSKANFKKFIDKPTLEILEKDPMVLYSESIVDGIIKTSELMDDANKSYAKAHKVWVEGMMNLRAEKGEAIYPDANSTLRLTYGKVLSYKPYDGIKYNYYTTLKGVMEKEDPTSRDYLVPSKLKELYQNQDYGRYTLANGEMPVCFIVDTDNTGGNSGSPVLNGKGHLVGTGFDRNYEGLTGDIAFRPSSQRAVCVDIRYILFIIDKYAGATHLLDELTIVD
mgnify:CR=1 FL=1